MFSKHRVAVSKRINFVFYRMLYVIISSIFASSSSIADGYLTHSSTLHRGIEAAPYNTPITFPLHVEFGYKSSDLTSDQRIVLANIVTAVRSVENNVSLILDVYPDPASTGNLEENRANSISTFVKSLIDLEIEVITNGSLRYRSDTEKILDSARNVALRSKRFVDVSFVKRRLPFTPVAGHPDDNDK